MIKLRNVFWVFILLLSLSYAVPARGEAPRFDLAIGGNLLFSSDSTFREVYSGSVFLPQLSLAYSFAPDFYAWTDIGLVSAKGWLAEIEEETSISQVQLGLGLGYRLTPAPALRLGFELGLAAHSFREKAMEMKVSGSGLGGKAALNLDYRVRPCLFLRLGTAYKLVSHRGDAGRMKLGGFQAGLGAAWNF